MLRESAAAAVEAFNVAWLEVVDGVLRPARPALERCLGERARHLAARHRIDDERAQAVASCEQRIDDARAVVFARNDGVVTSRMTALEREWRRLIRKDPDAGLMDLWTRIAPPAWIDCKRWRDSRPEARLDAAVALAADAEHVEAAEAAVRALRLALAPHGTTLPTRVRWRFLDQDADVVVTLLDRPLQAACDACPSRRREAILERAQRAEVGVLEATRARLPGRPCLARGIAHAAFVDFVWSAARLADSANPVAALRALWKTGYVLTEIDTSSVTLEVPPLEEPCSADYIGQTA